MMGSTVHHLFFAFQMLIPRVSYFPFCYEKLEKLFAKAVNYQPGPDMEMWLSFEDMPLKWYVCVCVI